MSLSIDFFSYLEPKVKALRTYRVWFKDGSNILVNSFSSHEAKEDALQVAYDDGDYDAEVREVLPAGR